MKNKTLKLLRLTVWTVVIAIVFPFATLAQEEYRLESYTEFRAIEVNNVKSFGRLEDEAGLGFVDGKMLGAWWIKREDVATNNICITNMKLVSLMAPAIERDPSYGKTFVSRKVMSSKLRFATYREFLAYIKTFRNLTDRQEVHTFIADAKPDRGKTGQSIVTFKKYDGERCVVLSSPKKRFNETDWFLVVETAR